MHYDFSVCHDYCVFKFIFEPQFESSVVLSDKLPAVGYPSLWSCLRRGEKYKISICRIAGRVLVLQKICLKTFGLFWILECSIHLVVLCFAYFKYLVDMTPLFIV